MLPSYYESIDTFYPYVRSTNTKQIQPEAKDKGTLVAASKEKGRGQLLLWRVQQLLYSNPYVYMSWHINYTSELKHPNFDTGWSRVKVV